MSLFMSSISPIGTGTPTTTPSPTGIATPTATPSPTGTATSTFTLIGTNVPLHKVETVAKGTVDTTLNIILTSSVMLVALGLGLLLRQICVRRLKKTVLDNW